MTEEPEAPTQNRQQRRALAKAMLLPIPRRLSSHIRSPNFDALAVQRIAKVLVNGVDFGPCFDYDMDGGWLRTKGPDGLISNKIFGAITPVSK